MLGNGSNNRGVLMIDRLRFYDEDDDGDDDEACLCISAVILTAKLF